MNKSIVVLFAALLASCGKYKDAEKNPIVPSSTNDKVNITQGCIAINEHIRDVSLWCKTEGDSALVSIYVNETMVYEDVWIQDWTHPYMFATEFVNKGYNYLLLEAKEDNRTSENQIVVLVEDSYELLLVPATISNAALNVVTTGYLVGCDSNSDTESESESHSHHGDWDWD